MANSFGKNFRITTAGESHGKAYTVIIEGCPPGIDLETNDFLFQMSRRAPGQSEFTTSRVEADQVEILSGVFENKTTGAPIALLIKNEQQKSSDYEAIKDLYRPGHADYVYDQKYGHRDYRGGGRASARETVTRVAASVVAEKIIAPLQLQFFAYTKSVSTIELNLSSEEELKLTHQKIDASPIRCPDPVVSEKMQAAILKAKAEGDSLGGVCRLLIYNLPVGLGEPVFDKLKSLLAHALFSLPAVTGVEFGIGFKGSSLPGSQYHDQMMMENGKVEFLSNNHGGILGGLSSGNPVEINIAIKPPSSIARAQNYLSKTGEIKNLSLQGRHDPCLLARFCPVAEAMAKIVIADLIQ
jgi:chorismate synthase